MSNPITPNHEQRRPSSRFNMARLRFSIATYSVELAKEALKRSYPILDTQLDVPPVIQSIQPAVAAESVPQAPVSAMVEQPILEPIVVPLQSIEPKIDSPLRVDAGLTGLELVQATIAQLALGKDDIKHGLNFENLDDKIA
jgi:hypothetical protein